MVGGNEMTDRMEYKCIAMGIAEVLRTSNGPTSPWFEEKHTFVRFPNVVYSMYSDDFHLPRQLSAAIRT